MRPSPGTVKALRLPGGPGIRVDTALAAGAAVPPHYDSLVAKVIAHGRDRAEAIARMRAPSPSCRSRGSRPTSRCTWRCSRTREFLAGRVHTRYLEGWLAERAFSRRVPRDGGRRGRG